MRKIIYATTISAALALSIWTIAAINFQPATFSPGDTLSASELNQLLNDNFGEAAAAFDAVEARLDELEAGSDGASWLLTGNEGTTAGDDFLGTTDDEPFEIHVAGERAFRLEPGDSPNVIGGEASNTVTDGFAATIGGGEDNTVSGVFGTVSGGRGNTAGDTGATVGGGRSNTASGLDAVVPGGFDNTAEGSNSFAAGRGARALHDRTFVWSSRLLEAPRRPFESTGEDQFLIHAPDGVAINTNETFGALVAEDEIGGGQILRGALAAGSRGLSASHLDSDGTLLSFAGLAGVSTTGPAANFEGDVRVGGNLLVTGSKNFGIDHPLDPENKILNHFAVESNEVLNVYRGSITLDEKGAAVIELPDYFDALNIDASYQLTPVGAPMPELHVSQEIGDNRFAVAGGEPGKAVSWEVTAVRNDPAAQHARRPVEEKKAEEDRGYYLAPQAFGLPLEEGIGYRSFIGSAEQPARTQREQAGASE